MLYKEKEHEQGVIIDEYENDLRYRDEEIEDIRAANIQLSNINNE